MKSLHAVLTRRPLSSFMRRDRQRGTKTVGLVRETESYSTATVVGQYRRRRIQMVDDDSRKMNNETFYLLHPRDTDIDEPRRDCATGLTSLPRCFSARTISGPFFPGPGSDSLIATGGDIVCRYRTEHRLESLSGTRSGEGKLFASEKTKMRRGT